MTIGLRLAARDSMIRPAILINAFDPRTGWSTTHRFDSSPVSIGRASDNTLRLPSRHVAPHHAEMLVSSKGVTLRSLVGDSKTWLDGLPVPPSTAVPVRDGATMLIGPVRLTVTVILNEFHGAQDGGLLPMVSPPGLGLLLNLAEPAPEEEGIEADEQRRRSRDLLMMFASALVMIGRHLGTPGESRLLEFRDPAELLEYLSDMGGSDRTDELGDTLAVLVMKIARLAAPVERWQA